MSAALGGWRRRGPVLVGALISAVCLVLIARQVDLLEVARELRRVRLTPLAASVATSLWNSPTASVKQSCN